MPFGREADFLKQNSPATNIRQRMTIPVLEFPVSWVETPITMVPIKAAPLPKISKKPKYSLDFSLGIILAK